MIQLDRHPSGRHFLQIPGPTNVPDRVLRAIDQPTIDHRGPEFAQLTQDGLRRNEEGVQDRGPGGHLSGVGNRRVGGGARQHALAGRSRADGRDGPFRGAVERARREARPRRRIPARRLAHGVDPGGVEARLAEDRGARDQGGVRRAQRNVDRRDEPRRRRARRRSIAPAIRRCYMVDTISSLASIDYRHDEWGVDVTVAGSQKGLMLPPGLSFNAISAKALAAARPRSCRARTGTGTRCSRSTEQAISRTRRRPICSTACTRRWRCCSPKGLDQVFARHDRLAEATRRAVRAWGLEILCGDPRRIQLVADRGDDAGGPQRRRVPQSRARRASTCRSGRARQARRAGSSASGTSATSTNSCCAARWPASKWAWRCRRPASEGRREAGARRSCSGTPRHARPHKRGATTRRMIEPPSQASADSHAIRRIEE